MTTVLVTGASGRIGRLVVPHLRAAGLQVVPATRDDASGGRMIGDLASPSDEMFAIIVKGIDVVLHLAGIAHRDADPAQIRAVNCDATLRLARAAAAAGVQRFVFASTIYAASGPSRTLPFEAETSDAPFGEYGAAKRAAEAEVSEIFAGRYMILRLAPVLAGPPAASLGALVNLCRKPVPLPFGRLENRRSLLSPHTLKETILAAVTSARQGIVPVCDVDAVSTADLARAFQRAAGNTAGLLNIPAGVVRAMSQLLLGREKAAALCDDFIVSTDALEALGVKPVADSLVAAVQYAQSGIGSLA